MTEDFWQKFKRKKDRNSNYLFDTVESELKRKFKAEKTPEEMYSMCKTDNNYWKHFRLSKNLDIETVGLVLCKNVGCDLMYCQALTFNNNANSRQLETYGCKEQFDALRECYISEKEKFSNRYKEEEWREDSSIIPNYLKEQLETRKKLMLHNNGSLITYGNLKLPKIDENIIQEDNIDVNNYINNKENKNVMVMGKGKDGYF